jgi:hypothetical protein
MRRFLGPWFTTVSRGPRIAAEHEPFVSVRELCRRVHGGDIYEAFPHESYQGQLCQSPGREAEFFQSIGFGDVDLLSIDAAHTYEAVYADICNWWPLVRRGGTVFGDDFTSHYLGVEQTV